MKHCSRWQSVLQVPTIYNKKKYNVNYCLSVMIPFYQAIYCLPHKYFCYLNLKTISHALLAGDKGLGVEGMQIIFATYFPCVVPTGNLFLLKCIEVLTN